MDWWKTAGEWRSEAKGTSHGEMERKLQVFAARIGRRPISVRKAVAARVFVEALLRDGAMVALKDAGRLASAPLTSVEVLKRMGRYGAEHVADAAQRFLDGRLDAAGLRQEEKNLRQRERAIPVAPANTHSFRLQSPLFLHSVFKLLPAIYPPPTQCHELTGELAACPAVIADAVAALPGGFAGVRFMAASSDSNAGTRMRAALQLGLAGARFFQEYVFVCQQRTDADALTALFQTMPPCGVGVFWTDGMREPEQVAAPRRASPPDLAVRLYGPLAALFDGNNNTTTTQTSTGS